MRTPWGIVSIRAPQSYAGRLSGWWRRQSGRVSIRAPQSHAGRQTDSDSRTCHSGFNPRPAVLCGATEACEINLKALVVFQSAPRSVMRGDRQPSCRPVFAPFQSAPRSLMRGDLMRARCSPLHWSFNPRPAVLCGATFAPAYRGLVTYLFQSAPRSVMRGDDLSCTCDDGRKFQSAPRSVMRGDLFQWEITATGICFNPRPAVLCGATPPCHCSTCNELGFNPRPALSCGATRQKAISNCCCSLQFQSAPRSDYAGRPDRVPRSAIDLWNVSIRAPQCYAGRLFAVFKENLPVLAVSIRAPQ